VVSAAGVCHHNRCKVWVQQWGLARVLECWVASEGCVGLACVGADGFRYALLDRRLTTCRGRFHDVVLVWQLPQAGLNVGCKTLAVQLRVGAVLVPRCLCCVCQPAAVLQRHPTSQLVLPQHGKSGVEGVSMGMVVLCLVLWSHGLVCYLVLCRLYMCLIWAIVCSWCLSCRCAIYIHPVASSWREGLPVCRAAACPAMLVCIDSRHAVFLGDIFLPCTSCAGPFSGR
jgi:hypothetical protein